MEIKIGRLNQLSGDPLKKKNKQTNKKQKTKQKKKKNYTKWQYDFVMNLCSWRKNDIMTE